MTIHSEQLGQIFHTKCVFEHQKYAAFDKLVVGFALSVPVLFIESEHLEKPFENSMLEVDIS